MATSRQIRDYAKKHNISKAEAKEQLIKDSIDNVINPFIIRGAIENNKVVYDTSTLDDNQANVVKGCVKTMNDMIIDENKTLDPADTLTCIMYNKKDDFCGHLTQGHKVSLDDAWAELKMVFDKYHTKGLKVGFTYTREEMVEMGTEMAGQCMDMLNEDGVWEWPNANATLQKKGDKMLVLEVA